MKKFLIIFLLVFGFFFAKAQENDSTSAKVGGVIGAVTADGQNYQQIGFRADIPIWKLGLGVDIQLLIDAKGNIRKADWDEWQDYLDKLYYIRWGHRNEPLYIKVGGLDYSYIGYSNIINGYSNMIQYPSVKRYGGEVSFYIPKSESGNKWFGAELFANNFKEMFRDKASMLFGARVFYCPVGKLEIGATFASDLNEYNGLNDNDDDGFPNEIDFYPDDKNLVTEYEYYLKKSNNDTDFVDKSVNFGLCDGTKRNQLTKYGDLTSVSRAYGFDIGYPIITSGFLKCDVYGHWTQLAGKDSVYGWGMAPGFRFKIGENFLTLTAEYRRSQKYFVFGFYNQTYELERAKFIRNVDGKLVAQTKQETLKFINSEMNGFYVGATCNFFGFVTATANYQDLIGDGNLHSRSLKGEIVLGESLKKIIPFGDVRGYYIQNNVQDFQEWKTSSTLLGYKVGYNFKGAMIGMDFRYTFQDLDGNGKIRGDNETIRTISFNTSISF